MSNPLFQMFGRGQPQSQPQGPFNNPMQMMQRFNEFKANLQGDPQQQVQELLKTGQMSQEQFNQLSTMAQVFRQFLSR